MDLPNRLLPLAGAYNFRDLGGYPTSDGRVTQWGQLFRSDTLTRLTEDDVAVLLDRGLASIIDLRTLDEVELSGRGLLGAQAIGYTHLPLMRQSGVGQGAPIDTQENLAQRYLWYLDTGRASLVEALTQVGDPRKRPLVFHCAVGKDRTGVLAALVLDILGVEREVIVEDYVLTASRMDLIMSRVSLLPNAKEVMAGIPQFLLQAEAETMETFLDSLERLYGGARQWALDAGVSKATLDAMPDALLTVAD